jgi:hypothetical protein
MNHGSAQSDDRLIDLIIQRSTSGLSESEQQELGSLMTDPEIQREGDYYDLTAAALDLSFRSQIDESMPPEVRERVLIDAGKFFSNPGDHASADLAGNRMVELPKTQSKVSRFSRREAIGLAVMAAMLIIMVRGWNPFAQPVVTASGPSVEQRLEQFELSNPVDLVQTKWQPIHDMDASGRVVWSDACQEGYMVFDGLDVNDPSKEQYQLWIFDTDKQQAYPIDGGVFDIVSTGESVVPIKAHVPVLRAVQFAITIEPPGGVTVSKRERIPLLASLD